MTKLVAGVFAAALLGGAALATPATAADQRGAGLYKADAIPTDISAQRRRVVRIRRGPRVVIRPGPGPYWGPAYGGAYVGPYYYGGYYRPYYAAPAPFPFWPFFPWTW